jgi:hypothetical protein
MFKTMYLKDNNFFINPIIRIISDEIDDNKNYLQDCVNVINTACSDSAVVAGHYYINIKKSENPRLKIKEYFNL